jgi:hypothetical protein
MAKSKLVSKVMELAVASEAVCNGKSVDERRSFLSTYLRQNGRVTELRATASEAELHEVDVIVESFAIGRPFGR